MVFSRTLSTAEVVALRNSQVHTLLVGADIGNLHSRAVWGDGANDRKMIESYILPIDNADGFDNVYRCIDSNNPEWKGKRWILGEDAVQMDSISGIRVMDSADGKPKCAMPLLVALLWDVLPVGESKVRIAISVHNKSALEGRMRDWLHGCHKISKDGETKTILFDVLAVASEGVGVIRKEKPGKATFMLDIGSDTLIGSAFTGYTHACNPWSASAYGVRSLAQKIMSCDQSSKALGRYATFEEVLISLENPVVTITGRGANKTTTTTYQIDSIDITEAVNCEAEAWLVEGLKMLVRNMKNSIDSSKAKLATGGGCMIPRVREILIERGYSIVADPLWSNASGLFEIAGLKAKEA